MRQQRSALAIFAFAVLFIPPLAWGCEADGMEGCGMSACPMATQREANGCHESGASSDYLSRGCHAAPEVVVACCEAPVKKESAKIDSASSWDRSAARPVPLAERLQLRPPSRPPDLISEAISSRQHELGRFTLLSSFLL